MAAPGKSKWYGSCKTGQCDYCIDGVSPYDFTKWGYVKQVESKLDDMELCSSGTGDKYLGVIGNECLCDQDESSHIPKYNNVDYVRYAKDCGPSGFTSNQPCIGGGFCSFGKCDASGNKYGTCGFCGTHDKYHYWYERDWEEELKKASDKAKCCATPPDQSDRTKSCPPDTWYASPNCLGPMAEVCVADAWSPGSTVGKQCDYYISSNMTDLTNGKKYNAEGVLVNAMESWAEKNAGKSVDPKDPFIDTALKWCNYDKLKGTCSPYLQKGCSGVTKKDMLNDKSGKLARMCACFLDSEQYLLPGIIPPQCDSLCHLAADTGGIPIYEYGGEQVGMIPKVCEQTTCVMDDVTVNYVNSQVGNISFSQLCGDCGSGGSCTCVLNNVDINEINSITHGTDIRQDCGVISKHGSSKLNGGGVSGKEFLVRESSNHFPFGTLVIVVIIALVLLLLIIAIQHK